MQLLQAIVIFLIAVGVGDLLRRLIQHLHKKTFARDALKKILDLSGSIVLSCSPVGISSDINIREPDAQVAGKIRSLLKLDDKDQPNFSDRELDIDRPASHLVVIGSTRYNKHAELIQKEFDIPYEYIFGSVHKDPGSRTLKIVTKHGEELTSSRDYRVGGDQVEVDYGILFLGNLTHSKRVFWFGGIHGEGTVGALKFLEENADHIWTSLSTRENTGTSWLLRTRYKMRAVDQMSMVLDVEALGQPRECARRRISQVPKALVCDLGNVLMYFDRMRTYRAVGYYLDIPFEEIKNRIERTDLREQYELGALTDREFFEEMTTIIGDCERKLTPELISEFWGDIFWPNYEMFDALRCLKQQGVFLVLLSNTNHLHYRRVEKDYPDLIGLFDEIMLSFEEGMLKPDEGLFVKAIRKVEDCNIEAPILFVDDNEDYVREANDLEMLGFVYRSYPHFVFWLRKMGLYVP